MVNYIVSDETLDHPSIVVKSIEIGKIAYEGIKYNARIASIKKWRFIKDKRKSS
ncbi:hypothetical protein [Staphylococcus argensis]|uniref:hypothetical protein n=1 Tax=Staphylococcus argensis TaxID=1607738 RepID=UPI001C9400D8|nr:hypothetical protein [Staphylococcus argensis]